MSEDSGNASPEGRQLPPSPFEFAEKLICGVLLHWPHQVQPVSLLLCGTSGNGKSHVVRSAMQLAQSATTRRVFSLVPQLAPSLARRNADGSTALRKDIRRAISSLVLRPNDAVSGTSDTDSNNNDDGDAETAAVVVILDHMELFITAVKDAVGLTHGDQSVSGHSQTTASHHPALMADVYGIIRGCDLFSETELRQMRLGCILFVTLFSGMYEDVDQFARAKLFDAYISLNTPTESERNAFFDTHVAIPPVLRRSVAARSGGVTYRGLMEVVEHMEDIIRNVMSDGMRQLLSCAGAVNSGMEKIPDSRAEVLAAAISLRAVRAFAASDSIAAQEYRHSAGYVDVQETHWHDIAGLDAVKQTLQRLVLRPLQYHAMYRRFGVRPSTGVLLCGPPGTGKTMLARAMATELNASFVYLDLPQLIQAEVGESERRLREFFRVARERSPSVMFIDELQAAFGPRRDAEGRPASSHDTRLVSQFLHLLDVAQEDEEHFTLFVGATNVKHMLDETLLRAGRLDTVVDIPLPDKAARQGLVQQVVCGEWTAWTSEVAVASKEAMHQALVHALVNDTVGCSGAELRYALNVFVLQLLRFAHKTAGGDTDTDDSTAVPRIMCNIMWDAETQRLSTEARGFLSRALSHATRR